MKTNKEPYFSILSSFNYVMWTKPINNCLLQDLQLLKHGIVCKFVAQILKYFSWFCRIYLQISPGYQTPLGVMFFCGFFNSWSLVSGPVGFDLRKQLEVEKLVGLSLKSIVQGPVMQRWWHKNLPCQAPSSLSLGMTITQDFSNSQLDKARTQNTN